MHRAIGGDAARFGERKNEGPFTIADTPVGPGHLEQRRKMQERQSIATKPGALQPRQELVLLGSAQAAGQRAPLALDAPLLPEALDQHVVPLVKIRLLERPLTVLHPFLRHHAPRRESGQPAVSDRTSLPASRLCNNLRAGDRCPPKIRRQWPTGSAHSRSTEKTSRSGEVRPRNPSRRAGEICSG